MKILNFGSLNIDYVYSLDHIVAPGETITSNKMEVFPGGKGLNQSVALAKAGAEIYHAGMVGADGDMLTNTCKQAGVDTRFIKTVEQRCGNAIIQVAASGQNSIVLFGGANRENAKEYVDEVLSHFSAGDLLLLQNEINLIDYLIEQASKKEMLIALNPSPFDESLSHCKLEKVNIFLLNEIECGQIAGENDPQKALALMHARFPDAKIVLTLGKDGVLYRDTDNSFTQGIYEIPVVDTTAAGDTFTGFFLASMMHGKPIPLALDLASKAAALAVSTKGASSSIPTMEQVINAKFR